MTEIKEATGMQERDYNFIICSACLKPCGIVHDLDMSDCCKAQLVKGKARRFSHVTEKSF